MTLNHQTQKIWNALILLRIQFKANISYNLLND
jgi:hypothetical protein